MSRRSRERANARPWEQEPDQPEHDDTERCPNTEDLFEWDDGEITAPHATINGDPMDVTEQVTKLVQDVARECAEICRELANTDAHDYNDVRNECAQAIRARFGLATPPGGG